MTATMTRRDREDLAKLVRRREKLAKADVDRVASERLADFENQLASIYRPEDDPVWKDLHAAAIEEAKEWDARMQERCRDLGVPERTRPQISLAWYGRGESADAGRRAELRRVAKTRTDADAKAAKTEIERRSIEVQTALIAGGLESDEARKFLDAMPSAEALMPSYDAREIDAGASRRNSEDDPDLY